MATRKTPTKSTAAKRPTAVKASAAKTAATKTAAPKTVATKTAAPKTAAPKTAMPKTAVPKTAVPKTAAPKPAMKKVTASKPAKAAPAPKPAADFAASLFAIETVGDIAPLAEEAMKPVEAAVAASKETLEAVVKAGTQAATKGYEQAVAMTQEQVEKASSSVFNGYDEVAYLGKDSMDAYVESSTVFARGFETFGKEVISFTQVAMEVGMTAAKSMAAAKSFEEVIELQSEYSRRSFDSMLAESAKLTDLSIALANDAIEPLQSNVATTVEKMMKPLAA